MPDKKRKREQTAVGKFDDEFDKKALQLYMASFKKTTPTLI